MEEKTPVVSLLAADLQGEADAHGEDQALVVVRVVAEHFEPARGRACGRSRDLPSTREPGGRGDNSKQRGGPVSKMKRGPRATIRCG